MRAEYRIGVIGRTGKGDYGHGLDVACTKVGDAKVVAVADENPQGLEGTKKRTGVSSGYLNYREMLDKEKLDIVAICPRWIDQHQEMILAAAEAGCHIYMEKPFCPTLAQCDSVIRELEMRHLQLAIAHTAFYSPVLDRVLDLIRGGEIGDLLELRGRGKEDRRGGGEDLWVLGSHIFGLMLLVSGSQIVSCDAQVTHHAKPIEKQDVVDGAEGLGKIAGDKVQAHFRFANGLDAYFASKRDAGGSPNRFALQIFGTKGVIEVPTGYMQAAHILRDPTWAPGRSGKAWETITSGGIGKPELRRDTTYEDGHVAAIRDLIGCIEQQRTAKCNQVVALQITEMIVAIYESQVKGGKVELPLVSRANPLETLA
jgi:predicted dehydrogenase